MVIGLDMCWKEGPAGAQYDYSAQQMAWLQCYQDCGLGLHEIEHLAHVNDGLLGLPVHCPQEIQRHTQLHTSTKTSCQHGLKTSILHLVAYTACCYGRSAPQQEIMRLP